MLDKCDMDEKNWLEPFLKASDLNSQEELAERLGVSRATVNRLANDHTKLKRPRAEQIASLLGTTVEALMLNEPPRPKGFAPTIVPGRDLVGDKNFPIYAAARGGSEGHQIVTFEAIDYVKRPAILESVKDAYGLYIVGESMIPAFEPGDMALVHPHLPPARDKNVVLYHVSPFTEAEAEAMVKRLLRYDDRDWHLRQFNPPEGEQRDFTVARTDWRYCHRIVGKYEAR